MGFNYNVCTSYQAASFCQSCSPVPSRQPVNPFASWRATIGKYYVPKYLSTEAYLGSQPTLPPRSPGAPIFGNRYKGTLLEQVSSQTVAGQRLSATRNQNNWLAMPPRRVLSRYAHQCMHIGLYNLPANSECPELPLHTSSTFFDIPFLIFYWTCIPSFNSHPDGHFRKI